MVRVCQWCFVREQPPMGMAVIWSLLLTLALLAANVSVSASTNMNITVSPDRGDGARMSWIQMADTPTGLEVNFYGYDTTLGGTCGDLDNFVFNTIASGLDRTGPHNIRVTMEFVRSRVPDCRIRPNRYIVST